METKVTNHGSRVEAHHHWMEMPERPSVYFRRQFWAHLKPTGQDC